MSIGFLSLPLIVVAVWQEVPQGFVTVEPSSELGLPFLKLLFGETSYWELGWGVYFSNWHDEAGWDWGYVVRLGC